MQEIIAQKFEPAVKNSEKNSGTEITSDDHENDANIARASTERSAPIPEVKVETIETPVSSPRVQKRASKPGRPGEGWTQWIMSRVSFLTLWYWVTKVFSFLGRPSRAARRNQRHRSKSATSTVRVTVSVNLPMRKRKSNHYESNYFRTNDFISSHRTMKVT